MSNIAHKTPAAELRKCLELLQPIKDTIIEMESLTNGHTNSKMNLDVELSKLVLRRLRDLGEAITMLDPEKLNGYEVLRIGANIMKMAQDTILVLECEKPQVEDKVNIAGKAPNFAEVEREGISSSVCLSGIAKPLRKA